MGSALLFVLLAHCAFVLADWPRSSSSGSDGCDGGCCAGCTAVGKKTRVNKQPTTGRR